MSIATVVTRGYGSFGSIAFVTTRGYGPFDPTAAAPTIDVGGDGKARVGARRRRSADDDLSAEEIRYMQRKLAQLRRAKTERERAEHERELGEALAEAARVDDAAEVIESTIVKAKGELEPSFDWAAVGRDYALLKEMIDNLAKIAVDTEREMQLLDDDEAAIMLLLH